MFFPVYSLIRLGLQSYPLVVILTIRHISHRMTRLRQTIIKIAVSLIFFFINRWLNCCLILGHLLYCICQNCRKTGAFLPMITSVQPSSHLAGNFNWWSEPGMWARMKKDHVKSAGRRIKSHLLWFAPVLQIRLSNQASALLLSPNSLPTFIWLLSCLHPVL